LLINAHSYHDVTDTTGVEDAILKRMPQASVHTRSHRDSFKSHWDLDGGCLVQVMVVLYLFPTVVAFRLMRLAFQLDSCEWPPFSRMRRRDGRNGVTSAFKRRLTWAVTGNGDFTCRVNSRLASSKQYSLDDFSQDDRSFVGNRPRLSGNTHVQDARFGLDRVSHAEVFLPQMSLQATMYMGVIDFLQVCLLFQSLIFILLLTLMSTA
jgi:hypothetical protein